MKTMMLINAPVKTSEHGSREGEDPRALLVEGATPYGDKRKPQ